MVGFSFDEPMSIEQREQRCKVARDLLTANHITDGFIANIAPEVPKTTKWRILEDAVSNGTVDKGEVKPGDEDGPYEDYEAEYVYTPLDEAHLRRFINERRITREELEETFDLPDEEVVQDTTIGRREQF